MLLTLLNRSYNVIYIKLLYQVIHHIIISYYLTRKKSFYFITRAWYCLFCALSMKYECTQSIWGLCKSLIRGKLNVPFGGSMKIYAYSIFWSQTTNAKSMAPNILFKTYVYQGMKICQRHTTTFHVGYIVCWCLKKEMLTMCVLIYDVGKLISSLILTAS